MNNPELLDKYLTGYCKKHKVSKEEAKTHATVKAVIEYYTNVNDGKIIVKEASGNSAEMGECK